ncbi:hypothetical protein ACFXPA_17370 [Amycolatopsis sp. NPDC059090]|uniref:hypothetical protein n=1 Tax=Amycolatopsis TaxID=1813 RepID=UPI0003702965|nr:hypothetical protein [Amycolatopsis benzoatilytica]
MTSYLKLDTYVFDGSGLAAVNCDLDVNGTRVSITRPFVQIGPHLAVIPGMSADGNSIRIRLDMWTAMNFGHNGPITVLPLSTPSQAAAVAAARAFEADPSITWSAPLDQLTAWCQRWAADFNAAKGGERT